MKCFTCKEQATERITFTNGLSQNYCSGCAGIFEDGTIEHRVTLASAPAALVSVPSRFCAAERARAKTNLSELTASYIQHLERIALAAHRFWKVSSAGDEKADEAAYSLYERLDDVNFLKED